MTMNPVFEKLTRIGAATIRARLLLGGTILLLASASISAQGFTLTSPTEGSLVPAGQPITVTWTGGNPSADVNVVLIDVEIFTVVDGFGVMPNSGSRVVTIDARFCGRRFQFYVEDSPRTTWTYGPVFTVVCRVPVAIDIKPGSFPNSINLGSNGTTPVAILGSATLNVRDIDVSTLTLGTAGVKTVGKTDRSMCSEYDVSGDFSGGLEGAPDGFLDLVCHFVTVNIVPEEGGTTARVMGDFIAGGGFEGIDSVAIVNSTVSYNTTFGARTGGGILNFSSFCGPPYYAAVTSSDQKKCRTFGAQMAARPKPRASARGYLHHHYERRTPSHFGQALAPEKAYWRDA